VGGHVSYSIIGGCLLLYFIGREILLIAGAAIKWNLHPAINILWDRLPLHFGRLHIVGFIRGGALKFDRLVVLIGHAFGPEDIIILWVLAGLNNIWLILIFVGSLTNEGNLIENSALG